MFNPYDTSLSGSTRTWYSRVVPPKLDYVHDVRNGFELLLERPVLEATSVPSGRICGLVLFSVYQ